MSGKAGPTSPADPEGLTHSHGDAVIEGVTTALSWLTIVPVKGAQVFDRTTGRRAVAALPIAGLVPGLAAALVAAAWAGWRHFFDFPINSSAVLGAQALVVGAVILVVSELLTRAMHIDGLADVADALGSYQDQTGAQKVLRDPATGPMGVGAVGLYFVVMVAGLATAALRLYDAITIPDVYYFGLWGAWASGLGTLILPFVVGRAAATTACHKNFPPMSETGFGALTAGTQSSITVFLWWAVLLAGCVAAGGLSGVFAGLVPAFFAMAMSHHCVRRLGGINGDVLGSIVQISTAICIVFFAF